MTSSAAAPGPVQVVVVGALVRRGRVLLVHRSPDRQAYPGVWDLPGGHVEPGESESIALARELQEELGVRIDSHSLSHLCRLATERAAPVLLSAWLVRGWLGIPRNAAPEEHDDIGWFPVDELPPLAHRSLSRALVTTMTSDNT